MREIEVKAKIKNIKIIKKKLIKLGCVLSGSIIQEDKIFIHKSINYPFKKKDKVVLRIRKSNSRHILTLKKNKTNELDCIEKETCVDKPKEMQEILVYMGYRIVATVKKRRQKCKYKDINICVDNVNSLGKFIELEKITENKSNGKKIQEELFDFLKLLGIKKEERVFKGYDTMISEKKFNN
jgi:adenylate cyclase, class 2